ncbi:MAG TPA: hypothetical protein VF760_03285, partial [Xanthobacteraceae bacterium]
ELDAAEIGKALNLTMGQVQRRLKLLYARLGVSSRHGAVLAAVAEGWLRWDGIAWRVAEMASAQP